MGRLLRVCFWLVVLGCFVAPLTAIAWQIASRPQWQVELWSDAHRLRLLAVTIAYNAAVAAMALALALPAAVALGRGRGWLTRPLWVLLPLSLLLPTITFEYGWKQALRLAGLLPAPQSLGDVARCIWTLACWLWPIPAAVGAIALRRVDPAIYEQAALDGGLTRVTLRMLIAPMLAASAAVFVLASQEFAVFEPTGIRVVATEVRMVFESGATDVGAEPIARDQPARVAAAIATAAPLSMLTMLIAGVVALAARGWATGGEPGAGGRPRAARASIGIVLAAYAVVCGTVFIPLAAMIRSLSRQPEIGRMIQEFSWIIYVFGGFLILTGIKMLLLKEGETDPNKNLVVRATRKLFPVTERFHGEHFFVRAGTDASHEAETPGSAVVADRVRFWSVLAEEQGRAVAASIPATPLPVPVPSAELGAAVDTLVGNVFAHTPPGVPFTVTVRVDGPTLVVADRGPGFPPGFDPTARGASGAGSTGLGLDIVRRLAERCHGSLRVGAAPEGGAVVEVVFGP